MALTGIHCKVCHSGNTESDIKVDGRQRFKCLDCKILFFSEEVQANPEMVHNDIPPATHVEPATAKATTPSPPLALVMPAPIVAMPAKIYPCKKCEYSTTDRYKLVSHYSSAHSWWHRGKESKIIEAYKRGDRVLDIYRIFGIRTADLYPILHKAKVLLRSQDPNHPASSMETRRQAKVEQPIPADSIHCPDCLADKKVFCPRDPDAECLICHQKYCGAHIGPHLEKVHCVSLNLNHCSE
jgi:transposase-like protein